MSVEAGAPELDFTQPYRLPYHLGIYLAINAIPDAYALIDGPDCLFRKAEWVYGKHDLVSTILDIFGNHRAISTLVDAGSIVKDRGEMVATRIAQVARIPGAAAVLVCSMPHVMIIGTQYDKILRDMAEKVPMALMEVPSLSLQGDWVDGYVESLAALAAHVDVSNATPDPQRVAVIGYTMGRTEADATADVAELERLFHGIQLELTSIWLSNKAYGSLSDAKEAGVLVALPNGRKAAHILAERTGAKVVSVATPFGPTRTQRMLRAAARAAGRLDDVAGFVDAEMRRSVSRLEWAVPHMFFRKRVAFAGAPEMLGGFYQIATEVGMEVAFMATSAVKKHLTEDLAADFGHVPPTLFAPTKQMLKPFAPGGAQAGRDLDLVIGDSLFFDIFPEPRFTLDFGFPSHFDHALYERPALGFRGWLCFLDRMAMVLGSRASANVRLSAASDRERRADAQHAAPAAAPTSVAEAVAAE